MAIIPTTEGDSATSSDSLTAAMTVAATVSDSTTSGDSLSASVSGFYVEKLLNDTAVTSDTLTLVAGLTSTIADTELTSDTVTLTSVSGSSVIKPQGDFVASGDSLGLSMTVHLTISDGAVTSDLVSKPRIPKAQQTDQLSTASTRLVPLIPGGAQAYAQQQIQDLQTMAKNLLAMVPQAATQAPATPVDGMVRLSRNPWHPVAGQTVDAWVYYDGAAGAWVYQATPPVTT